MATPFIRSIVFPFLFLTALPLLRAQTVLTVTVAGDTAPSTGGSAGDLRYTLNSINQTPGAYNVVFNLPSGSETITLGGMLPLLGLTASNALTIDGSNTTGSGTPVTISGNSSLPGFFARQGDIAIQNITIANTLARGGNSGVGGGGLGAGGALFIDQANVTLSNVTMNSNTATGGNLSGSVTGGGGMGGTGGGGGGGGGLGFGAAGGGGTLSSGGGGIGAILSGQGGNGGASTGSAGAPGGGYGAASAGNGGGAGGGAGGANGGGGGGGGPYTTAGGGGGGIGGSIGTTDGGNGGYGGGGGGGSLNSTKGGDGGFGGGGGSGAGAGSGGQGGFGGGGGYGGSQSGNGGFGAGCGSGSGGSPGVGGVGGGTSLDPNTANGSGAGLGGAIFVNNSTAYGSGGGTLTVAGPLTITNSSVTAGTIGANQYRGAAAGTNIFSTSGSAPLTFSPPASTTITLPGTIADDSANSLPAGNSYTPGSAAGVNVLVNGQGTLAFSGANTYSGGTTIQQGTLKLNSSGSIVSSSTVSLTGASNSEAVFDISSASSAVTIGDLIGTAATPGTVTMGSKNLTLGTSNNTAFNGIIQGTGLVTKTGTGTLTLAGPNTYSGGTTINQGKVALSGSGSVASSGAVTLAGASNSSAVFDMSASSSSVTIGDLIGTAATPGTVTMGSNNLTLGTSNSTQFKGVIEGTGSLTKTGSGNLTLSGPNTYNGGTTINQGQLLLTTAQSLAAGSDVTLAGTSNANAKLDISAVAAPVTIGNLIGDANATPGTVVLGATPLTLGTSSDATFNGIIQGTGTLTKTGSGILTLAGTNTYTGDTTVNQGTLSLPSGASIGGNIIVDTGAILKGAGTIAGTGTINGTLSPGNSIGTIAFNNNLTLASSSTTVIEIDPTTSSQIQVTGAAALAGTLQITPDAGTYTPGQTYTILTATTGVSGIFNDPIVAPSGFSFDIHYPTASPFQVILTLMGHQPPPSPTGLAISQFSGNNLKVAKYLNSVSGNLGASFTQLSELTASSQNQALTTLNPNRVAFATFASQNIAYSLSAMTGVHFSHQRQFRHFGNPTLIASISQDIPQEEGLLAMMQRSNIATRQDHREDSQSPTLVQGGIHTLQKNKPYNVWMTGFGEFSTQDAEHQNPKFNTTAGGLLLASDWGNLEQGIVGGALSYTHIAIHEAQALGHETLNGGFATLYGMIFVSDFFFDFALWGGIQHIDNKRNIFYPGFYAQAKSMHNAFQFDPHFSVGYDWYSEKGTLEPFIALDWANSFESSYTEYNAAPYNMKIHSRYSSMLKSEAGLNGYYTHENEKGAFITRGKLSYINKKPFHTGRIIASIAGAPGSFTVETFTSSQNLVSPSLEFYWGSKKGAYFSVLYDGEFGQGYIANEITGRIGLNF